MYFLEHCAVYAGPERKPDKDKAALSDKSKDDLAAMFVF